MSEREPAHSLQKNVVQPPQKCSTQFYTILYIIIHRSFDWISSVSWRATRANGAEDGISTTRGAISACPLCVTGDRRGQKHGSQVLEMVNPKTSLIVLSGLAKKKSWLVKCDPPSNSFKTWIIQILNEMFWQCYESKFVLPPREHTLGSHWVNGRFFIVFFTGFL